MTQLSADLAHPPTTEELRFDRALRPELEGWGAKVEELRHLPGSGELHVNIYLPSHDRVIRDKVLGAIQEFERQYAYTVAVSASLLYLEDED